MRGVTIPPYRPDFRSRVLAWLARRMGPSAVLPTLISFENTNKAKYAAIPEARGMASDEHNHMRMLREVVKGMHGGLEGSELATLEGRHRAAGGNALRAAVLGANDGLVSNLSLVMGVAGAELNNHAILITGLAGLLAGAFSMALGEWLSVQSSRELYQHQINIEAHELETHPEEEAEELALIYEARGLSPAEARRMANRIVEDKEGALDTLVREELSVDPTELGGSAWEAAITSFLLFSVGAIIPVLAFFFTSGTQAVITSMVLSGLGLFVIGAGITLFTGRPILFSGMRQVLFGLAAAVVTFTIGRLIGVNLGG